MRECRDTKGRFWIVRSSGHQHTDAPHPAALLRARRERPRDSSAAKCDQQFPPSDGDCHTPLPREVRKRKDTTRRARSLHIQGGQDAGCFHLCRRLQLHYSHRQFFANAAIAASRVGS